MSGRGQGGKRYSKRVRKGQGRAKTGKGCEYGSKDVKDGYEKKGGPRVRTGTSTAAAYSPALTGSTIGDGGLNFSVRDGKRWDPASIAALIRRGGTVQRCPPRMRQERDT